MAAAIDETIVRKKVRRNLQVVLRGKLTRGMTIVDWQGHEGKPENAEIILEIDKSRYIENLFSMLR